MDIKIDTLFTDMINFFLDIKERHMYPDSDLRLSMPSYIQKMYADYHKSRTNVELAGVLKFMGIQVIDSYDNRITLFHVDSAMRRDRLAWHFELGESPVGSALRNAVIEKIKEYESFIDHPKYNSHIEQNAVQQVLKELRYLEQITDYIEV